MVKVRCTACVGRVRLVRACGSKPKLQLRILPHIKGQARKSLWIETINPTYKSTEFSGQARKSLWIETWAYLSGIRSKAGQARKSLWIETLVRTMADCTVAVRLVRACGSKPSCFRKAASSSPRSGS